MTDPLHRLIVSALLFGSLCFVCWKGLAMPRPAAVGAEREREIRVRASRWTHAFCALALLGTLTMAGGAFLQGGRGAKIALPIAGLFLCLLTWLWRAFSRHICVGERGVRIIELGGRERALPLETLTKLDVSPPSFIVEARFADGTRLTFFPFLFNADEGARRVILGASEEVVAAVKGPAREAIRLLREQERDRATAASHGP